MTWPRLLLIADHGTVGGDRPWLELVTVLAALEGLSVPAAVQLRVKDTSARRRARLLERALTLPHRLPLVLNGTLAEAIDLGADGVHWPEGSIPDERPPDPGGVAIRGASIHSIEAAARAARAGATHVVLAPVYPPRSKGGPGRGLDALRAVATACPLPVLALGGIDEARVSACLRAGAAGVAVVGALLEAPDPAAASRRLAAALAAA